MRALSARARCALDHIHGGPDMGIRRRRLGRTFIAVASTAAVLACAGAALALQGLPAGGQVNNDPAAGIDPTQSVSGEDPANADVVGGALTAGVGRAVGGVPPAGGLRRRPVFVALVRGRSMDNAGGRHDRRQLERGAIVRRLAELRPGRGRRGAGDRLRRRRADRAVGDLVRGHDRERLRGRATSSRAASTTPATRTRASGCSPDRAAARRHQHVPVPSLNIHTNREAENPSVAGAHHRADATPGPGSPGRRRRPRPGPVNPIRSSSRSRSAQARPPARGYARRVGRATLPDGGFCWQQTGSHGSVPRRGPKPERRPHARRGQARHRLHRHRRTMCPGSSGTRRGTQHDGQATAQQRDGVRCQGRQDAPPPTAGSTGRPWAASSAASSMPRPAPQNFGSCAGRDERGNVLAEHQPGRQRRGPARRRRHDGPRQPDRALGGLGRDRRHGTSRCSSAARRGRRGGAVRDRQRRCSRSPAARRLEPARHHVLGQHAVRVVARGHRRRRRAGRSSAISSTRATRRSYSTAAARR